MNKKNYKTIEAYIADQDAEVQTKLREIDIAIRTVAPKAVPCISYQMPTYKQEGVLIHFAAAKEHIGIYPGPKTINYFSMDLEEYECSKGAIRIPLYADLPIFLIQKMTLYRMEINLKKKKK